METSLCLVCCPGCRKPKICLSAYAKHKKSENADTNMIRSALNQLSDCWTFSVGLGEKENLQEDLKNSSGFFGYLMTAPPYKQRNCTETVENQARREGKPSSGAADYGLDKASFFLAFLINVVPNLYFFPSLLQCKAVQESQQSLQEMKNAQDVC